MWGLKHGLGRGLGHGLGRGPGHGLGLAAWASQWSVLTDEVAATVHLLRARPIADEETGDFLRKPTGRLVRRWCSVVCGAPRVEIARLRVGGIAPAGGCSRIAGVIEITARYAGRAQGGGLRFEHVVRGRDRAELMRYASRVELTHELVLPVFPPLVAPRADPLARGEHDASSRFAASGPLPIGLAERGRAIEAV